MYRNILLVLDQNDFTQKAVADCTEFDILAADVFDSDGYKLLCVNTVITDYIIAHLSLNHIQTIPVYKTIKSVDQNSKIHGSIKKYYGDTVLRVKKIVTNLSAGASLNYDEFVNLADEIVGISDILHRSYVVEYIGQIKSADQNTYIHSINVAFYSMLMAKWLGLPKKEISLVAQAGLLHDLGKIKISTSILKKEGPLTASEFTEIKTHPLHSYKILLCNPDIDMKIKEAVLLHHERFNGSGYPFGVTSITLFASIIAIADVYDAMTSDRVYKKGVTPFKAFEYFKHEGASLFDWHILNVFIENISALLVGSYVKMTSGDTAKIVCILPDSPLTPVLYLNSEFVKLPLTKNSEENNLDIECMVCIGDIK